MIFYIMTAKISQQQLNEPHQSKPNYSLTPIHLPLIEILLCNKYDRTSKSQNANLKFIRYILALQLFIHHHFNPMKIHFVKCLSILS